MVISKDDLIKLAQNSKPRRKNLEKLTKVELAEQIFGKKLHSKSCTENNIREANILLDKCTDNSYDDKLIPIPVILQESKKWMLEKGEYAKRLKELETNVNSEDLKDVKSKLEDLLNKFNENEENCYKKIKELEKHTEKLLKKSSSLTNLKESEKENLSEFRNILKDLQQELKNVKKKIDREDVEDELKSIKRTITSHSNLLERLESRLDSSSPSSDSFSRNEIESLRSKIRDITAKIENLPTYSDVETFLSEKIENVSGLENIQFLRDEVENTKKRLSEEVIFIKNNIDRVKNSISNLQSALNSGRIDGNVTVIESDESRILRNEIRRVSDEVSPIQGDIGSLKNNISDIQSNLTNFSSLKEQIDDLRTRIQGITQNTGARDVCEIFRSFDSLEVDYNMQISLLRTEVNNLKSQIDTESIDSKFQNLELKILNEFETFKNNLGWESLDIGQLSVQLSIMENNVANIEAQSFEITKIPQIEKKIQENEEAIEKLKNEQITNQAPLTEGNQQPIIRLRRDLVRLEESTIGQIQQLQTNVAENSIGVQNNSDIVREIERSLQNQTRDLDTIRTNLSRIEESSNDELQKLRRNVLENTNIIRSTTDSLSKELNDNIEKAIGLVYVDINLNKKTNENNFREKDAEYQEIKNELTRLQQIVTNQIQQDVIENTTTIQTNEETNRNALQTMFENVEQFRNEWLNELARLNQFQQSTRNNIEAVEKNADTIRFDLQNLLQNVLQVNVQRENLQRDISENILNTTANANLIAELQTFQNSETQRLNNEIARIEESSNTQFKEFKREMIEMSYQIQTNSNSLASTSKELNDNVEKAIGLVYVDINLDKKSNSDNFQEAFSQIEALQTIAALREPADVDMENDGMQELRNTVERFNNDIRTEIARLNSNIQTTREEYLKLFKQVDQSIITINQNLPQIEFQSSEAAITEFRQKLDEIETNYRADIRKLILAVFNSPQFQQRIVRAINAQRPLVLQAIARSPPSRRILDDLEIQRREIDTLRRNSETMRQEILFLRQNAILSGQPRLAITSSSADNQDQGLVIPELPMKL
jgi:hypothetical protein